jgi:hypothetical protein
LSERNASSRLTSNQKSKIKDQNDPSGRRLHHPRRDGVRAGRYVRRLASRSAGANYFEDQTERGPGPELGDYLGLPISDAARQFADSWDPSRITLPEEQCRVHVSPYIYRGPLNLRIWEEKHPKTQNLIAIKHYISTYEQTRTIWMDGRPHPGPNAPHTWMGFSTGHYEGDMLVIETTHLKQGWLRRNGLPMSDQARMTEYLVRRDDLLTHIFILTDPVYLTEPLIKSEEFTRPRGCCSSATGSGSVTRSSRSRIVPSARCPPTCRASIRSRRSSRSATAFPRSPLAAEPRRCIRSFRRFWKRRRSRRRW